MRLKVLLHPGAEGAFFAQTEAVTRSALGLGFPDVEVQMERVGALTWLTLELEPDRLQALARWPLVQALFEEGTDGRLDFLDVRDGLAHPAELVTAAKYRGKTHERATQLGVEIGLAVAEGEVRRLLDPMAGRGTTLLCGARYGLECTGIEQDPAARDHLHRHVKRQTKLRRIKHKAEHGSVGPKRADQIGRFVNYRFQPGSCRLVTGDARRALDLLGPKPFDVLVTDLPYGVQFKGPRRDPLPIVQAAAPGWVASVRSGGALVLLYNRLQPARGRLAAAFEDLPVELHPFQAPHRMSESIERDFLVLRRR